MALHSFILSSLNPAPVTRAVGIAASLSILRRRSIDYGFFGDIASGGLGAAFGQGKAFSAASIGVTLGVIRSMEDFAGTFNETGVSGTKGILSIGGDIVFGLGGEGLPDFIGLTATIGIGRGALIEAHSRVGSTFVFSVKNGRRIRL